MRNTNLIAGTNHGPNMSEQAVVMRTNGDHRAELFLQLVTQKRFERPHFHLLPQHLERSVWSYFNNDVVVAG